MADCSEAGYAGAATSPDPAPPLNVPKHARASIGRLIDSLPAHPTAQQALEWIERQHGQLAEGARFSFAIADAESDIAIGAIGLGLRDLSAGRATAGYAVSPAGYQREGLLRSHQEIGGIRRDLLLYATTRP